MKDELVIGRIRSSFGTAGEMKVESFSGEIQHFKRLKTIGVRRAGSTDVFSVESVRASHKTIVLKLHGVDSREAVAPFRNAELVVRRSQAAPLKKGEYYYGDLHGLTVTSNGKAVGTVAAVWETGTHPLLEIVLETGGNRLVPFQEHFFGEISLRKGEIVLNEPAVLE